MECGTLRRGRYGGQATTQQACSGHRFRTHTRTNGAEGFTDLLQPDNSRCGSRWQLLLVVELRVPTTGGWQEVFEQPVRRRRDKLAGSQQAWCHRVGVFVDSLRGALFSNTSTRRRPDAGTAIRFPVTMARAVNLRP